MDDLIKLNVSLAKRVLGDLTQPQIEYLESLPVCACSLVSSIGQINKVLSNARPGRGNTLPCMYANRDYTNYLRLSSKDALRGVTEKFVEMGISYEMAELFASLTNEQVTHLALYHPGEMFDVNTKMISKGAKLHGVAKRYHASAFRCTSSV